MTKGWAKQIFSDLIRPSPSSIISAFSPSIRTTARLRLQIWIGSEVKFRTSTRRSKNHPPGSVPPAIVQERSGLLNRAMCSWIIAVWYGLVESVFMSVSYTHLRAHETDSYLVCRLLLEKQKK